MAVPTTAKALALAKAKTLVGETLLGAAAWASSSSTVRAFFHLFFCFLRNDPFSAIHKNGTGEM